ncbi:hypothetical protein [Tenggerimyces flavus]|uniref:Uncharacterized protein n=1 Tax=Tenggerimyces flavus TaxID=1708749 RepID=A0ABV7YL46_9ACTN|nr:hypothetical protein [Tenggerimyces flavus]MBM7790149.1 hypothetical protein [Tenggerimyces flavus]
MAAASNGNQEPLVFPIGHYVGANYPFAGAELESHLLRIGWEIYPLGGNDQLGIWALAHGLPGEHDTAPWTLQAVGGAARMGGIPDATRVLDELIGKDLVVEVTPGTAGALEFAKVVRTRSLLSGIGNTRDEPSRYGIGLPGAQAVVNVPLFTYELWRWGHTCDSLWHVSEIFAQAGRRVVPADPDQSDPERVLARCLRAAQTLIANGAIYLDEAREEFVSAS